MFLYNRGTHWSKNTISIFSSLLEISIIEIGWRCSYGNEINDLQKALKEVQTDNTRSQEDILEVSRKLQDAYVGMKNFIKMEKVFRCLKRKKLCEEESFYNLEEYSYYLDTS